MSSESSVSTSDSSRIRQFGLYRTIDARTEEFLRQSRKRQIKQGCVCATISTAITVTVVITVLLVYMENGSSRDSNKKGLGKSSWIGLINDSLSSPFEESIRKSKLNFDRTTIKLLPLLIKALKHNRYLEKIIEDYTSSSPAYEGRVTTEYSFKKNIFANSRNWIKNPTSRLFAVEYKTSPVVYFKKPTKKLTYFTKIRKIRDYKKIIHFVDKMVGDEVVDHTSPMSNDGHNTQTKKPPKQKLVSSKKAVNAHLNQPPPKISKPSRIKLKTKERKDILGCKCPAPQLSILLNKIVSSIQQFLPDVATYVEDIKQSTDMKPTVATKQKSSNSTLKKTTLPLHMSEFDNVFQKQDTTMSVGFANILHKESTTAAPENNVLDINKDIKAQFTETASNEIDLKVTTIKQNIEPTEFDVTVPLTQPMTSASNSVTKKDLFTTTITSRSYKSQLSQEKSIDNSKNDPNPEHKMMNHIYPLFFDNQKTSSSTFKPAVIDEISKFDIHSLELFKSKVLPVPMDRRLNFVGNKTRSNAISNATSHFNKTKKLATTNKSMRDYLLQKEEVQNATPFISQEDFGYESQSSEPPNIYQEALTKSNKKLDIKSIINIIKSKLNAEKKQSRSQNFDNTIVEDDEIDKVTRDEDYHEEYHVKPTESMASLSLSLSNNTVVESDLTNTIQKEDMWSFLNSNYDRTKMKSMIPLSRPTYLEIHRNSWKNDENEDYDLNMKYNVFDIL